MPRNSRIAVLFSRGYSMHWLLEVHEDIFLIGGHTPQIHSWSLIGEPTKLFSQVPFRNYLLYSSQPYRPFADEIVDYFHSALIHPGQVNTGHSNQPVYKKFLWLGQNP